MNQQEAKEKPKRTQKKAIENQKKQTKKNEKYFLVLFIFNETGNKKKLRLLS